MVPVSDTMMDNEGFRMVSKKNIIRKTKNYIATIYKRKNKRDTNIDTLKPFQHKYCQTINRMEKCFTGKDLKLYSFEILKQSKTKHIK